MFMIRGRRGLIVWLVLLGLAVFGMLVAAGSGAAAIPPLAAAAMLLGYIALVLGTLAGDRFEGMRRIVPSLAVATKASPAAKRATAKASGKFDHRMDDALLDVGLIVNEKRNGRWERRLAETPSMDDGAIQPFISLQVSGERADRMATIDFELYDHSGKLVFSQSMQQYVREGENLITCDRQMPLRGSESLGDKRPRAGIWDLRVRVDGGLAAIHNFTVGSSTGSNPESTRRAERLADDGERMDRTEQGDRGERLSNRIEISEEDAPISLEDLLREQRSSNNSSRRS
jgi:hypothetical protein